VRSRLRPVPPHHAAAPWVSARGTLRCSQWAGARAVGEGRRGRADTGRDPADMLFAVHVAVWGSAL